MARRVTSPETDLAEVLRAIASDRRPQILDWLKDPATNFSPQVHGDPLRDGACNLFIGEKPGISQPAASRHLRVLVDAGLIVATRRKGWTCSRRDEAAIDGLVRRLSNL